MQNVSKNKILLPSPLQISLYKNKSLTDFLKLWFHSKRLTNLWLQPSGRFLHSSQWVEYYKTLSGFWPISLKSEGRWLTPRHGSLFQVDMNERQISVQTVDRLCNSGRKHCETAHTAVWPPHPHWGNHSDVHSRAGHSQRGPYCYLRVENRANTQGQYRCVTKGLCVKYHWGCVCAHVCHSFHWTCIHYSIHINRKQWENYSYWAINYCI